MLNETSEQDRKSWRFQIAEHRTPPAIAAGISFGIAIGLIPKDSLIVVLLMIFVATLPIHQLLACAVAITVTLLSPWSNSLTHPVGERFLSLPFTGTLIGRLYSFPLMPWLRLENTLVIGGAIIGVCAWLPSYFASLWFTRSTSHLMLDRDIAAIASSRLRHRRTKKHSQPEPSNAASTPTMALPAEFESSTTCSPNLADAGIPDNLTLQSSLQAELNSYPPETVELANLVLEVQETMLEAAKIRSKLQEAQMDHAAGRQSILHDHGGHANYLSSPMAESSQGVGMTMLSPVGSIGIPIIPNNLKERDSLSNGPSPSLVDPTTTKNDTQESQSNSLVGEGVYRDDSGRQYFNHSGSKEESLRHILRHIHSLRNARTESEKTV